MSTNGLKRHDHDQHDEPRKHHDRVGEQLHQVDPGAGCGPAM